MVLPEERWARELGRGAAQVVQPLAPFVAQAGAGAAAYAAVLGVAQGAALGLRVSCAAPLLGPALGLAAVATASAAAGQASLATGDALAARSSAAAAAALSRRKRALLAALDASDGSHAAREARMDVARDALLGLAAFRLLGGTLRSALPSDIAKPGAFARHSVPCENGAEYCTETVKRQMHTFYGMHGCHTCGTKSSALTVVADHMPPNVLVYGRGYKNPADVAKRPLLERLVLWWKGLTVQQRFYPQCQPCSNAQGEALRKGVRVLRLHPLNWGAVAAAGGAVGAYRWAGGAATRSQAQRLPNLRRRPYAEVRHESAAAAATAAAAAVFESASAGSAQSGKRTPGHPSAREAAKARILGVRFG